MTQQRKNGIQRIVSGGQTGVDRGALDAAIYLGLPHGGWCPRGRIAEDGLIPHKYELTETTAREYWVRTEQNVIDSDGTLILYRDQLRGGTQFTRRMAKKHRKPLYLLDLTAVHDFADVRHWIAREQIATLNCAGPRESSAPGIEAQACQVLTHILTPDGKEFDR